MSDTTERDILQRVARLEQRAESQKEVDKKRDVQVASIITKLDTMELNLARYRGLVGGVLLVVTAVVTFIKFVWSDLLNFFGK